MKLKAILEANTDEKKRDTAKLEDHVKEASIRIQQDLLVAERNLVQAERDLKAALISNNFSSVTIINAKRAIADYKEDIKDLEALKTELF